MKKYKVLAIMGKSGSGKDSLKKAILTKDKDLHGIIHTTSRPKREGEIDGINYHFLTPNDFTQNHKFFETNKFNNWLYGTEYSALEENKISVGIFSPSSIMQLSRNLNIDFKVVYVIASDKVRLLRQLNREENPNVDEIIRRYIADKNDFEEFYFHDMITIESNITPELMAEKVLTELDEWLQGK